MLLPNCVFVNDSRHKQETAFIGDMELVSLRYNYDFASAESYGSVATNSIPPMHGAFLLQHKLTLNYSLYKRLASI